MQPRIVDLNEVVATMKTLLKRLIGEDVRLESRLAADVWAVRADVTQLEQVLMNLVVNARDAMPAGGTIAIQTANAVLGPAPPDAVFAIVPGEYVLLSVADTGIGMEPEVRARAFEPFFTTKELGRGTGLGLSTVYGIVKQSGGYIWVDSEPGYGTRVRIYLPRERASRPLDEAPAPATPARRGHETLLLVEDEDGVRDMMQEWLESHGYHVLAAADGLAALELSSRFDGRIDLLLADVVMPAMGGPALATRLRPVRPGLRVMYMSGYADDGLGDRRLGADTPFLQKPFTLGTLVDKVRETLDRP
jgi:CheY-like chemotaxis protein